VPSDAARIERESRVLILVRGFREGELTRRLLAEGRVGSVLCADEGQLLAALAEGAGALLLAEEVLGPDFLRKLSKELDQQPAWSDLPVLVFSAASRPDGARNATSAALGNVSFLDRPVHVRTMLAAVRAALRSRNRQYEARKAIESRDAFLAMLGHELRNPLGAISFALSSLNRKGADATRPLEYEVMGRQVRHLSRLVDELLDVARVTTGKVSLDRHPLDLAEVAEQAFDAFEPRAHDQGLTFRLEVSERPLITLGDRQRLEQALGNLITNAIKYTPRGGDVVLRISGDADSLHVEVSDSGIGISEDMLERIFAPFAQVDASLDRSQGGLGLGLALVRSLVALHEGSVRAYSAGLGHGARFVITLPRSTQANAGSVAPSTLPPQISPRRILLVEDNADIRTMFTLLLRDSGHSVTSASDGPSGLEALLNDKPDLAFVDIGLPGFDGYELARRVRASGSSVWLIALTGYGQEEDRRRAAEAGFSEHLSKPVREHAVWRAISRAQIG
jgi:signal transduction histidine kinase